MIKSLVVLILGLMVFQRVYAQIPTEKDTLFYYMKSPNLIVNNIKEADYLLFVLPVDSKVGKKIYPVAEYYTNGKLKLVGYSTTHSETTILDGTCTFYFYNGVVQSIKHFDRGNHVGIDTSYYPNGKIYTVIDRDGPRSTFIQCNDSTGKALTEKGNGKWIYYYTDFDTISDTATIVNGHRQIREAKFSTPEDNERGEVTKAKDVEVIPQFPGGLSALMKFVTSHIHFRIEDLMNNGKGRIFVQFVIEKDGSLSNIKVLPGPSQSMMKEALRVVKLFPKWVPGSTGGLPVRVAFTLPIAFSDY